MADFEYKVSRYEEQSGEKFGDKMKIAIAQRDLADQQLQTHLILHAARLSAWELARQKVQAVLTTRHAIGSYQQATPPK